MSSASLFGSTSACHPGSLCCPRRSQVQGHWQPPGQLSGAALVQGLSQQQRPPLLLREDVCSTHRDLCRREVLLVESRVEADHPTPGSPGGRGGGGLTPVRPEPSKASHQSSCHHHVRSGGRGSGRNGGEGSPGKPGLGRRKTGHLWLQAKDRRVQDHRASVSPSGAGWLRSSNVSSTTCHRQFSSGNSLSTRLTRK